MRKNSPVLSRNVNSSSLTLPILFLGVLSHFDQFLPRIQFGKPVNPDGSPMSATGASKPADVSGFSYLKRDLVRLLGVLAHGVKEVQERTRAAGGLPVVMNLCVVDERNPCASIHH